MSEAPPPPPPPHGSNPRTSNSNSNSNLPPGKYDIFIIPPHSQGSGFLYLPSLKPNVNSFAAGFASALIIVALAQSMAPAFRTWWSSFQGMGNFGMILLVAAVGVGAWALGRIQQEGGPGPGGGPQGSYGGYGPSAGGYTDGFGSNAGPHPNTGPPPDHGPPPPPPPHNSPPPPRSGPPPTTPGADKPKSSWQERPEAETPKGSWEKAREETRRKDEERKVREAEQRKKEEILKRLNELRQKEARERARREQEAKDKRDHEAREKEKREKEAAEIRERAAREKKQREEEQQKKDAQERAAREKKQREEEQQKKDAQDKAQREKELRETRAREARERELRDRLEREKSLREKYEREAKEREAARVKEAEAAKAREAETTRKSTYAFSSVGEKTNPWPNGKPPARPPSPAKPNPTPTSAKRPPAPSANTFHGTEDDTYSYRPYDQPKGHSRRRSGETVFTESSYAPSQSTSRTTPPPSMRGPYTTKDPDKIVIKAVYAFVNQFSKTPASQLISGVNPVTDGLILRITTAGLFIDDDVRGIAQREWDVKAWTLKLMEVWCSSRCFNDSNASSKVNKTGAPRFKLSGRGQSKTLTGDDADTFLTDMLHSCKDECRLGPHGDWDDASSYANGTPQTAQWKQRGLHVLRATIKDQEGKRYMFVLDEEEGWKLAVGLQRLRKGSQARQLGIQPMSTAEAKNTLEMLGW